tara:strand:+ start:1921 stop:5640 length:3720 start_codon:yes stop_codon:yes gene_type:complete
MAISVYSEVTAVSTNGYERDRVLDKLRLPKTSLPYTVDEITISHNDFAVSDVYNDSIRKLYSNYLYLIANAEIATKNPPTSGAPNFVSVISGGGHQGAVSAVTTQSDAFTHLNSLSGLQETHLTLKTDGTEKFLLFNYSRDYSCVGETDIHITSFITLLSGNEVEFNKSFKFKNVVSVDIKDNILFVLDKGSNTVFKFDITGLITDDTAMRRTGVDDSEHPGRWLLKTIGGEGISQTKNKLLNPTSLSVYKDKVYILDNGHNSLKVFDLDFNFIREVSAPNLFNNENSGSLVSIVVDQYSDTNESVVGYILSSKGKILEYNTETNTIGQPQALFKYYDTKLYTLSGLNENDSFKKIVNSKAQKNILYTCNNGKIYKYYKSNLNQYISVLDLTINSSAIRVSGRDYDQQILSFDTALYNDRDYIAVTTRVNHGDVDLQKVQTYFYYDEHTTTKLYSENFYTNYFTLSDILVLPQEIVNNITFNKTTKKLIYNHYSFFESLNKKIYSFYNTASGYAAVPTLCTINAHEFSKPSSFNENSNMFIGVNEPLLTDVVNRPLKLLYTQQEDLFNLIKEESLNSNPPRNVPVRLPANTEGFPNVLSLSASTATVSAGDDIAFVVTKTNVLTGSKGCSFKYYTTLGTAQSGDIQYIDPVDPSIALFADDDTTRTLYVDTLKFFGYTTKTFDFVIEQNTNCIVDPDLTKTTVTITPAADYYTISMSATNSNINEGTRGQIGIVRSTIADGVTGIIDTNLESAVNIKLTPLENATSDSYTPSVTGRDEHVVTEDSDRYSDFPGTSVTQQTSAAEVGSTSTIYFTDTITSVVFDVSAIQDSAENTAKSIGVTIYNPTAGSIIGTSHQTVTIGQEYKTTNLYLSSISASYVVPSTVNTLSCVNIWEALSASTADSNTTAFSTFSATNPYEVNFTVHAPLTSFSVSTLSAAIQFWPDHDLVYNSNKLNLIVEGNIGGDNTPGTLSGDDAALIGKGGRGGHGAAWLSGSDFRAVTGSSVPISANYWIGEDGGPAIGIDSTYFSQVSVANYGIVCGGAGGGGGGLLGLSAQIDTVVSKLSAGGGGGGGAGIHAANYGLGGIAGASSHEDDTTDLIVQLPNFRHVFVNNGSSGTIDGSGLLGNVGGGGAGGGFSDFTNGTNTWPNVALDGNLDIRTKFPMMTGLSGGSLGAAGASDPYAIYGAGITVDSTFANISAEYGLREGGEAGLIVDTEAQVLTADVGGLYKGTLPLNLDS